MPFADELIGTHTLAALTASVREVVPRLPALRAAAAALPPLTLRERSDLLRDALLADLPGDYDSFAATVRAVSVSGWAVWPVTSAVAAKAVADGSPEAFDDALALLAELTPLLTSEFALRVLLNHDLDRALAVIEGWTASPDEHVRRLASEGTRPFLPWAVRVPAILERPHATVPILDALHRDESEYVRRSVANHLNDLNRREPDLAVAIAARWSQDSSTVRTVRHGLRTLIKQGHPQALALLGFTEARLDVTGPETAAEVHIGQSLTFKAAIRNDEPEPVKVVVDYVVHHRKANGSLTAKTFKITTRTLAPGERLDVSRTHSFKVITTRRYHPGTHAIELQVNGVRSPKVEFTLLPEA